LPACRRDSAASAVSSSAPEGGETPERWWQHFKVMEMTPRLINMGNLPRKLPQKHHRTARKGLWDKALRLS